MSQSIFICKVTTQFENVGDMLICRTLLDLLSRKGPVYVVDDHVVPREYLNELLSGTSGIILWSVNSNGRKFSLRRFAISNLLSRRRQSLYLVSMPGHLFRAPERILIKHLKALIGQNLNRLLGVRYVRVGFSLGDLSDAALKYLARVYRDFDLLGLRDSASLEVARQYRFGNVLFTPDLAWAYDVRKHHADLDRVAKNRNRVVISVRGTTVGRGRDENYIHGLAQAIDCLLERNPGLEYSFSYQVAFDKDLNREFFDRVSGSAIAEYLSESLTLDKALKHYASADVVVSNRLHVLLVAILAGSIPIALTDLGAHSKITVLFQDNGLEEFLVNIKDPEALPRKLAEVRSGGSAMKLRKLAEVVEANRQKFQQVIDEYL